jgi:hypothetical protein
MLKRCQTETKLFLKKALKNSLFNCFLHTNEKPVFFCTQHKLAMRVIPTRIVNTSRLEKAVSNFHYLNPFQDNDILKLQFRNKPIDFRLLAYRDSLLYKCNRQKPPVPAHIVRRRSVPNEFQLNKLNSYHQNKWIISRKIRSKRSAYSHYSSNRSTLLSTYRE